MSRFALLSLVKTLLIALPVCVHLYVFVHCLFSTGTYVMYSENVDGNACTCLLECVRKSFHVQLRI